LEILGEKSGLQIVHRQNAAARVASRHLASFSFLERFRLATVVLDSLSKELTLGGRGAKHLV